MVNAGFNPLEEISRKTGKSIGELKEQMSKGAITSKMVQDAFISVTSAGGKFYGMSAKGAETLNGQISMLQESFDNMFNELGQKGEGVVMTAVQTATKLVENYERTGRVLLGLVTTFGIYRTAVAVATMTTNGYTLAETLAYYRTLLLEKATKLLNITMLNNPYVIAATALGTLVGVIIATTDGLTTAERAQKAFNDTVKQAEDAQAEYNKETEQAIIIANDDSAATDDRRKAMNTLIARYPSIIKKYIDEKGHLRDILKMKREIAAFDGMNTVTEYKGKAKDAKQAAEAFKIVKQAKQKALASGMSEREYIHFLTKKQQQDVKWANTWYEKNANPSWYKRGTTQERLDFATNFAKNYENKASRTATDNALASFQEEIGKMSKQRLATLKQTLTKAKNRKSFITLPYNQLKGVVLNQDDISNLFTYTEGVYSAKTKNITKKDLQDQKKSLQEQLDGLSEQEAAGKKGAAIKKKIAELTKREEAYSISTSGSKGGGKTATNADTSKPIDYAQITREQSDAERELAYQVSQSRIDAEEDAAKREQMQRELNHKKELEQIDKQKENYLKKKQDEAEAEFKADPKNKDKTFDRSTVTLTEAEQKQYDEIRANAIKRQQREDADYQYKQIDALNTYLKEYGSFEEKKLAITQEYEEKIRRAGSIGEKATLEMQRDKEIETAKNEGLQNAIDWNGVFSDLQGHTKQYLQGLRNQLQELLNAGNLPIDQMQTVSEKINSIDDELGKQQGIWDFVGERTREHNRLLKEAADAQERLNIAKAEEVGANANLGFVKMDVQKRLSNAGVKMNISDISTANLNGKIDLTDKKFKDMVPLLQNLAVAEGRLADARKKVTDATNKAKQAEDGAKRSSSQAIADWFSDAQEFITTKGLDNLPDLFGSIGLGSIGDKVSKGLDGFNNAAGAAVDFASGNYIGAAIKGLSAIKSFGSALGIGGGNEKSVADTTERLTKSNEELAKRIDDLADVIGDSAGVKAVNAYNAALKAQEEINKNNMEILKAQMGYHSAHHSNSYYANDKVISSYNNDAQLAFKAAGVDSSDITGLDSIYSLSPEQLKAIRDFAPNLWKYLTEVGKYDKTAYWDAVVEQAGKTEGLTEKIKNNLTQTSFDNIRNSFLDILIDMDADAEEWSKNFEKMMFKSMVNSFVLNDEFDEWLKNFQKKWADKISSGEMKKEDWDAYNKEYNDKIAENKKKVDDMAKGVGYSGGNSSQKATINEARNLSEDTGSQIVGRLTAVQIAVESGNNKRDGQNTQLSLMNMKMDDFKMMTQQVRNIADETRSILADSYLELKGINENTGKSALHLGEIRIDIKELKKIMNDKL